MIGYMYKAFVKLLDWASSSSLLVFKGLEDLEASKRLAEAIVFRSD
jgi:hypothetical protein